MAAVKGGSYLFNLSDHTTFYSFKTLVEGFPPSFCFRLYKLSSGGRPGIINKFSAVWRCIKRVTSKAKYWSSVVYIWDYYFFVVPKMSIQIVISSKKTLLLAYISSYLLHINFKLTFMVDRVLTSIFCKYESRANYQQNYILHHFVRILSNGKMGVQKTLINQLALQ